MSPPPSIPRAVMDASVARVAALPPDRQSPAIAEEAKRLGISVANWRSRRSKRKHALKTSAPSSASRPSPSPQPDGPTLLERARLAAAGGPEQEAGSADDGADPIPNGKVGNTADQLSPETVVAVSVFLVERIGRIFGAIYKLPPAAIIAASHVTEEEKQQLRDAAPLAMAWIRKQLAMADDTAGLYLYLFTLVTIGWSKVDQLGTIKAMREAQDRPHRWNPADAATDNREPPITPSEILQPPPDEPV